METIPFLVNTIVQAFWHGCRHLTLLVQVFPFSREFSIDFLFLSHVQRHYYLSYFRRLLSLVLLNFTLNRLLCSLLFSIICEVTLEKFLEKKVQDLTLVITIDNLNAIFLLRPIFSLLSYWQFGTKMSLEVCSMTVIGQMNVISTSVGLMNSFNILLVFKAILKFIY